MKITPPLEPYEPKRRHAGLGTLAETVINTTVKPAARLADSALKTNLVGRMDNCAGCTGPGGRKDRLNAFGDSVIEKAKELLP